MIITVSICILIMLLWIVLSRIRPRTAFGTLPLAIAAILFSGVLQNINQSENIPALVFSMIWSALTFLICLLVLARTPFDVAAGRFPWPRIWAKWILIVLGYLSLLTGLLVIFNLFGLLLFALFVAGTFRFQKSFHYAGILEVVSVISHCVRRNLPLPMALHTAAQHHPDSKSSKIMESVSHWLVQGQPLGQALRSGWAKAPAEVLTTIEAAEKISQLPQALESLEKDLVDKADDYKKVRPVHPFYPMMVLSVALLIMFGLLVFIVPTFAEVLSDMSDGKRGLPQPTQGLVDLGRYLTSNKGLPVLLILLGLIVFYKLMIAVWWARRRPGTRLTSLGDWIKWHLPLQRWFERNYSQLRLVEYLRPALRAGRPINEALREAAALDVNGCYRKCLLRWVNRIENGQPFADAARRSGMGPALAWAFDEGLNRQNLPEILTLLEETTRGSYDYRANLLRSALWPVVIVLLGLLVGFFVYAFFMPIVQLIYITLEFTMP